MSQSVQAGEVARRVGVKLLVGIVVALSIVYLPMAAAVSEAETAHALNGIDFGPTLLSGGMPELSPGAWRAIYGAIGLAIALLVYWSFDVPWRATIIVAVLALIAAAVTLDHARGTTSIVVVFAALAGAIGVTIWHDQWLGGYIEDEPA